MRPATAARATSRLHAGGRGDRQCAGPVTVVDPLAWEGKGNLIMIFQNVHTMTDCLDVCKFSTFSESLDGFATQFATITGKPCTADDLFKAATCTTWSATTTIWTASARAATTCPSVF